jgi:periplasmic divalent cation tolerance protein
LVSPSRPSSEGEPAAVALAVVLCTAPATHAERVARSILEQRVAACVNIVPGATSLYWWEGAIESASESLLVIKTRQDRVQALTEALIAVHPYEVPEVLVVPTRVGEGHAQYLAWVAAESRPSESV